MLLQCKRIRPNGTTVTLGTTSYSFLPNKAGDHVCDVEDKKHLKSLLAIAAYDIYDGEDDAPVAVSEPTYGQVVAAPVAPTPVPTPAPPSETVDTSPTQAPTPEPEPQPVAAPEPAQDTPAEELAKPSEEKLLAMSEEELISAHLAAFGKPPHPAATEKTIIKKILGA